MEINFFDDPSKTPRSREEVRLNQLALYVHPDQSFGRRVAVGFDLTPFLERPTIEVRATNLMGEPAGSLTVIQTNEANFHLTMHLKDKNPTDVYKFDARVFYSNDDGDVMVVDMVSAEIDITIPNNEVRSS